MEEVHYCANPALVRVFPGTVAALLRLAAAGFELVIVTNQSGIGRGMLTVSDFEAVQAELLRQLEPARITATYFCPDHPDLASERRKPAPGMILEAAAAHRLDLARSWLIGDKGIDVECGRAAGVRPILVRTGYGATENAAGAEFVAKDLEEAAEFILRT